MTTSYRRRQKLKRNCKNPAGQWPNADWLVPFRFRVARIVRQQQGQPVRLSDVLAETKAAK